MPKSFYQFFSEVNRTKCRKVDSKETKEDIKQKVAYYLLSSNIINTYKLFCIALFQPRLSVAFLPFERQNLVKKAKRELELALRNSFYESPPLRIKSKFGKLDTYSATYSKKIVRNIFYCLKINVSYLCNKSLPKTCLPNKLYHGTTTKFLPRIKKEGLLPSETGKCWEPDRKGTQKVCLTDCIYIAEGYAVCAATKFGGKPIVLELDARSILI